MNSKDFITALRTVIREEVQSAIKTEFKQFVQVIAEQRVNGPAPIVKTIPKPSFTDTMRPTRPAVKKQYSSNSMLNDILNDTEGLPGEGPQVMTEGVNIMEEWPEMKYGQVPSMPTRNMSLLTDIDGKVVDTSKLASTSAGAAVVNALTKDYSAFLKAAKEKSKIGR